MVLRTDAGKSLPPGLRYIVIFSGLQGSIPPLVGSPTDVELLEAANLALRRHAAGVTDAFLFVMNAGSDDESRVAAIAGGGQSGSGVDNEFYAWAVRPGDVASMNSVPEPQSLALLCLALAGMAAIRQARE